MPREVCVPTLRALKLLAVPEGQTPMSRLWEHLPDSAGAQGEVGWVWSPPSWSLPSRGVMGTQPQALELMGGLPCWSAG